MPLHIAGNNPCHCLVNCAPESNIPGVIYAIIVSAYMFDAVFSSQFQERTSKMPSEPASTRRPVNLSVNGQQYTVYVEARRTLLDALREDLDLTGAKKVCDMGQCGACTVIKNGRAVYSCLTLAVECEGQPIQTIEGLAETNLQQPAGELRLHAIQRAFIECDAFQCGYCTPGQIMAIKALLERNPDPTLDEVKQGVSGNLCRCGAYPNIFRAALRAAELLRDEAPAIVE
jgi:xanthine dehydrogenase YagT iron-sulfur-binding subunit